MRIKDIIAQRKNDVGRRIRLIDIANPENDLQMKRLIGQTGTIEYVDDAGNYYVDWDNVSSNLSVLIEDTVEFLDEYEDGEYEDKIDERYDRGFTTYKNRHTLRKTKRNTINESIYSNDDIDFVAKNVARHLGMGCDVSLSRETYNDFIELLNNEETRDKLIKMMNIYYDQFFL